MNLIAKFDKRFLHVHCYFSLKITTKTTTTEATTPKTLVQYCTIDRRIIKWTQVYNQQKYEYEKDKERKARPMTNGQRR